MKGKTFVCMTLCAALSLTWSTPCMAAEAESKDAGQTRYVIQAENEKSYWVLEREYQDRIVEETAIFDGLEEANMLVLNLSEDEAEEISYNEEISVIEKDAMVKALSEKNIDADVEAEQARQWNLVMMNATEDITENVQDDEVKVGILDTGVSASSNVYVEKRINLIEGEEFIEPLFEDTAGHGTAVASIIAGRGYDGGVKGVNKAVKLYSAKVLDDTGRANISRVAEGIYWCIEQGVDIINMSFGTQTDSEILHRAVQAAEEAGILMIAAAGNNGEKREKVVDYPAAYSEVLAVASVDTEGNVSAHSSVGSEVEVAAPGEMVPVTDWFDEVELKEGTSMAAAEVSGVASVLLAKDNTKSPGFIRQIINASANQSKRENDMGNGIVDLEYALSVYDDFVEKECAGEDIFVPENQAELETQEENLIEASWLKADHTKPIENYSGFTSTEKTVLQRGMLAPDTMRFGMSGYPIRPVNGFGNYVANYLYIARMAKACLESSDGMEAAFKVEYPVTDHAATDAKQQKEYIDQYIKLIDGAWMSGYSLNGIEKTAKNKAYFLLGIALHTAMDAYAHRAAYDYKTANMTKSELMRIEAEDLTDTTTYIPERWKSAKQVGINILNQWKSYAKQNGSFSLSAKEFMTDKHTEKSFYLSNFETNVRFADFSTWIGSSSNRDWYNVRSFYDDRPMKTDADVAAGK